jgi:hypothetical protein
MVESAIEPFTCSGGLLIDFVRITTGRLVVNWGLGRTVGGTPGIRPTWAALSEAMRCWRVNGCGSSAIVLKSQNKVRVWYEVNEEPKKRMWKASQKLNSGFI